MPPRLPLPPVFQSFRVTLKEQYSDRYQDVVVSAVSVEDAGQVAMRQNAGWTAQHQLTVAMTDLSGAEQRVIDAKDALLLAQGTAAQADLAAQAAHAKADADNQAAKDALAAADTELNAAEADLVTAQKLQAEKVEKEAAAHEARVAAGQAASGDAGTFGQAGQPGQVSPSIPSSDAYPFTLDAPLRTNGPTIEEFTRAGYAPGAYPPEGYAVVASPGWQSEQERRKATASQADDSTASPGPAGEVIGGEAGGFSGLEGLPPAPPPPASGGFNAPRPSVPLR